MLYRWDTGYRQTNTNYRSLYLPIGSSLIPEGKGSPDSTALQLSYYIGLLTQ